MTQALAKAKENKLGFLHPRNLDEALRYSKIIADSGLAPKDYQGRTASVLVAIQMGAEVGLSPMQALQNIAVINGRPSLWGDALLAVVQSHPLCEDIIEEFDDATMTATCIAKRKGRKPVIRTFSRRDAEAAGLWGKCGANGKPTPWVTYPKRMLQMRARAWACRDAFSDALRGLQCAEEVSDIPVEVRVSEPAKKLHQPENDQKPEYHTEIKNEKSEETIETADQNPALVRLNFGIHEGSIWGEVPREYLRWLITNAPSEEVREAAKQLIDSLN